MVLQVGDKVLVYGAGTPWAFAKKIEPLEVGDKCDVVTLSDGTKLAMPKIELDLSEYVWVVPEFDTPFNIGDVPFQWGMMPLGAAVFTVTGVTCRTIQDSLREWEDNELDGCLLFNWYTDPTTKYTRKNQHTISGNTTNEYYIAVQEIPPAPRDGGFDFGFCYWNEVAGASTPQPAGTWHPVSDGVYGQLQQLTQRANLSEAVSVAIKWRILYFPAANRSGRLDISLTGQGASKSVRFRFNDHTIPHPDIYQYQMNPSFPDYDVSVIELGINSQLYYYDTQVLLSISNKFGFDALPFDAEFDYLHFLDADGNVLAEPCVGGVAVGDHYVIYNPVTKRLVFNDSNKTILASPYWRDIEGPGEEISTTPVTYAWDGQGQVYLSQSKTTLSTIFYDNELQVSNLAAGKTKTIPYHSNDPFETGGETVSWELVNITSILRAGNNEITLTVRDTAGNKIGFPTPVYIVRSMS